MNSIAHQLAYLASPSNMAIVGTAARSLPVLAGRVAAVLPRCLATIPPKAAVKCVPPQQAAAEEQIAHTRGRALSPLEASLREMQAMMPPPFRRMSDHMLQMQREMDSLMGAFGMPSSPLADPWDIFDRVAAPLAVPRSASGPLPAARTMALEAIEDTEGYTLTAEVPGYSKENVKVSLSEDGLLTLAGSLEEISEQAGEQAHEGAAPQENARSETPTEGDKAAEAPKRIAAAPASFRRYASFSRSVQLPDDADTAGITATTQHGVLTVRIPKVAKAAPKVREIPVA